jgi:hypothetical protein
VIGGWAFNRYAEPRVTGDIDFFVNDSIENERALRAVLEKFGFGSALPPRDHSLFVKKVLMLGRPPNRHRQGGCQAEQLICKGGLLYKGRYSALRLFRVASDEKVT